MRIISWNCQGAFRKKIEAIVNLSPDILIVQECEHPSKLESILKLISPNNYYWHGEYLHKGLAVYSFSQFKVDFLPIYNPDFKHIIPFCITAENISFNILAVWAMPNKDDYRARYIGQVWLAINYYWDLLKEPVMLIGDFNSNKIWDYRDRVGNHTDVVNKLSEDNIYSIYHRYFNIEQGKEIHPTFFLQRNLKKPYHIDYCFASEDLYNKVEKIEIGPFEYWKAYSDHSPLIIDFNI